MNSRLAAIAIFAIFIMGTVFPSRSDGYEVPPIEAFFGASNIVATTGNGAVTVGVSDEGDVTVLSWPSPSYYDHLQYVASNDDNARNLEHAGALDRMGVFSGILVREATGALRFGWLRDDPWDVAVAYTSDDSSVIRTRFAHDGLRIVVDQYDFVPPGLDVWIRHYVVERLPSADIRDAWIIGYSNLSPGQTKVPELPIADFAFEQHQDFLAAWDTFNRAIVHFHPGDTGILTNPLQIALIADRMKRDFGPLGELLQSSEPIDAGELSEQVYNLDANYAPGVYVLHGSSPEPVEFQIGEDDGPICDQVEVLADNIIANLEAGANPGFTIPVSVVDILKCGAFHPLDDPRGENLWLYRARDAYEDALDGTLESNPLAGAQVNTALKTPLVFAEDRMARATFHYAFGGTRAEAAGVLRAARGRAADELIEEKQSDDAEYVARLELPPELDDDFRAFVQRAFLNLRVGTDRQTGAIVASISRQPSYHVDWPRDGVFFNVALDLAGQHDLVEKRLRFYADVMRREAVRPTPVLDVPPPGWPDDPRARAFPPGSWEMNYYADGTPGGNIRLEIDNTALVVWNMVEHVGHLDEPAERIAWLDEMWPTLEVAADFLATWRDPETGLIWPSNEDDHIEYTQGMQGSGTTFAALRAAAMAARALGHEEQASRWAGRAAELRAAIFEHLVHPDGSFRGQPTWSPFPDQPPTEWVAWPIRLTDFDDPRLRAEVRAGLDHHLRGVRGERPRGQYPTKAATSAALVFAGEPEAELALEIARTLATVIATPQTRMLGEVYAVEENSPTGWINIQGNPHLWSAILVFVTAAAYYEPEAFDRYLEVLPPVHIADGPDEAPDAGPSSADVGGSADLGGGPDLPPPFSLDEAVVSGASCACSTSGGPKGAAGLAFLCLGMAAARRRRLTS